MKDPYQEIRDRHDEEIKKNKREFITSLIVVFVIFLLICFAIYYF